MKQNFYTSPCFIACLSLIVFGALVATTYFLTPRYSYACLPNDAVTVAFHLYPDHRFQITSRPLPSPDDETVEDFPPQIFSGRYTEGPATFDLFFENATKEEITTLFSGTTAGNFIGGPEPRYRMNKESFAGLNRAYVSGCLISPVKP